jgi:cytochrome c oxidase subunit 2
MWKDFPLFPEAASTAAREVDLLYFFLVAVSAFFALLISIAVVYLAVRYRRSRSGAKAVHIEGSMVLEIVWSVIPLCLAMTMFVWGTYLFFAGSRVPPGAMQITVTGKQWMWKVQHPTGQREINDLHLPVDVPIEVSMTSEDVIHSFFIPAFRTKQDVLPGRYSHTWFQANKVGTYDLYCAEYCGTKHSTMIGKVYVLEQDAYQSWLAGAVAGDTPEQQGEKLFTALRCDTCHNATSGARGPNQAGLFGTTVQLEGGGSTVFDAEYVRESVLRPNAKIVKGYQPIMPTYQGQLGEEQILALIAYLKTLTTAPAGSVPK